MCTVILFYTAVFINDVTIKYHLEMSKEEAIHRIAVIATKEFQVENNISIIKEVKFVETSSCGR